MQKSDNCAVGFTDNSSATCEFNPALIRGFVLSRDVKKKLPAILSKAALVDLIASREIYLVKGFIDAPENEVSTVVTSTTGYGATVVTSNDTNVKVTYNLPYSQCQFRQLQGWSGVVVSVFPIDSNDNIGGTLVAESDGSFSLRGQVSKFIIPKSLPMRFNSTDIVVSPYIWIADNITINSFEPMNVELEELEGIVSLSFAVTESSETEVTFSVTAGCNGTGIEGLDGDLVILNSAGSVVSATYVENEDKTYTATGTLTAGTYSVNLASSVVEVGDNLYAALSAGLSFTTTA
jgi:hypothetical protein